MTFEHFIDALKELYAPFTPAFAAEETGVDAARIVEAARAVGLTFGGVMAQVVLPQAFRASVPPLASVQIALLKNTSVAAVFGVAEAVAQMRSFTNDFATQRVGIFLCFATGYIVLVAIVSFGANRLERHWRVA